MPEKLQDGDDELWDICLPYWEAFNELNGSRPQYSAGMAGSFPGRLLYSEKLAYAASMGLAETRDDLREFMFLVNSMDRQYLQTLDEQRAAAKKAAGSTT